MRRSQSPAPAPATTAPTAPTTPTAPAPLPPALTAKSKRLSWLLRHGAREAGVGIDSDGWVSLQDALRVIGVTAQELEALVRADRKGRFELRAGPPAQVRACQGHSGGVGVSAAALEESWRPLEAEGGRAWHGTSVEGALAIASSGLISPRARTHVHLAAEVDSVVGKRAGVAVLLGVDIAALREVGGELFMSPNGVLLAREVPTACVVEVRALTRAGQARLDELRAAFRLPRA